MDIAQHKPIKGVYYANTYLQRLDQHLFAVGYVAKLLIKHYLKESDAVANAAFVAGAFHDLGKLDPNFQQWVVKPKNQSYAADDGQHIDDTKFSFEKHPRHNEISVLLFYLLDDRSLKSLNMQLKVAVKHAIYWHHAKPYRKKNAEVFENCGGVYQKLLSGMGDDCLEGFLESVFDMLRRVEKLDCRYNNIELSRLTAAHHGELDVEEIDAAELSGISLPAYKLYPKDAQRLDTFESGVKSNAVNNRLRACVITADRWVSSLTAQELDESIKQNLLDSFVEDQLQHVGLQPESDLVSHISDCLKAFPDTDRTRKQAEVAGRLATINDKPRVLAGAAGCGKTKIALEWAKNTGVQKLLWICPRVQICQGLFKELSTADKSYLPDANIELLTGEYKFLNSESSPTPEDQLFSGDIVITTIDQVLSAVVSHTKADSLLVFLSAHVVFDEYHEYINMPAFNLLLAELLASKTQLNDGANTLLVSATPHYAYLQHILGMDVSDSEYADVVEMPSFNPSRYRISFQDYDETVLDDSNPLYAPSSVSTFVISNTATTAQKSFLKNQVNESVLLLHSKFKKSDKRLLFDAAYECFQKAGSGVFDVLRSGPIVQASLNISCDHMVSEITTAENLLQRLGRLDRFGKNTSAVNTLIIAVPEKFKQGKRQGGVAKFLSSQNSFFASKAWYDFLLENEDKIENFVLPELYALYREFYRQKSTEIEQDLLAAMRKSEAVISSKLSEPQVIVLPKTKQAKRAKISRNSLRGDSGFVQLAVCDLTNPNTPVFKDQYAYDIAVDDSSEIDNLSESLDVIETTGILDYLAQKHARIDEASPIKGIPASKTSSRKAALKSYARDAEYPLYLSYTESDMAQKLGKSIPYSEAIYYITTEKQAVGSLALKHFMNQED